MRLRDFRYERIFALFYRLTRRLSNRQIMMLLAMIAGLLASAYKKHSGFPRIAITVPSIVIMVPGLYLYRAIYNLGMMNLSISASWFASATLIILALPLGLIFARIMTDKMFRYCT